MRSTLRSEQRTERQGHLQRFLPIIIVEGLKAPQDELTGVLASCGYEWFTLGLNFLAVHPSDPTRQAIKITPPAAARS